MQTSISLYDVVAVTEDVPDRGLVRGQVGTVVHLHDADTVEVDFSDSRGRTYALVAVQAGQLMVLHHEPAAV